MNCAAPRRIDMGEVPLETHSSARLGRRSDRGHAHSGRDRRTGGHRRRPPPAGRSEARGVQLAAAAGRQGRDRLGGLPRRLGPRQADPVRLGHRAARLRQARTASRSSSPSTASAAPAPRRSARAPSSTTRAAPAARACASRRRVTTKNPLWANAAKAYDFVGFDPRGVGHSAPISCVDPQEFVKAPKADPVPDSEADKRAQRKLAARVRGRLRRAQRRRCCRT